VGTSRSFAEQTLLSLKLFEEGCVSYWRDVIIEYRFANGEMERLPPMPRTWSGSVWTSSSPPQPPDYGCAMKDHTIPDRHDHRSRSGQRRALSPVWRAPAVTSPGSPWMRAARFGQAVELLKETLPNLFAPGHSVQSGRCAHSEPADVDGGDCPGTRVDAYPGRSTRVDALDKRLR